MTEDAKIYDIAKSMTHWGRTDYSKLGSVYKRFEKRYWYDTLGYDYQMTELQAAFGIVQLARVEKANKLRAQRWAQLDKWFRENGLDEYFYLPENSCDKADPSWFAYPVTIRDNAPFTRKEFALHLLENNIEIRPIFTGNILKHPAFRKLVRKSRAYVFGDTFCADRIGDNGLFLPAWGMSEAAMDYMIDVLAKFLLRDK